MTPSGTASPVKAISSTTINAYHALIHAKSVKTCSLALNATMAFSSDLMAIVHSVPWDASTVTTLLYARDVLMDITSPRASVTLVPQTAKPVRMILEYASFAMNTLFSINLETACPVLKIVGNAVLQITVAAVSLVIT